MRFLSRFLLPALPCAMLLAGCGGTVSSGTAGSSGLASSSDAVTSGSCPGRSTVLGIDVSEFQGTVNWAATKSSGVRFAIARVSDGFYRDPDFDRNWRGMKAAGLIRGAYQFFEPGSDAVAQANIVIGKVGRLGPGDLPVMLDMEVTNGLGRSAITAQIHRWVNRIEQGTGKRPFIYTGAYFWDSNVVTSDFAGLPLDVAWYGTNCPGTPNAWGRHWTFHQYTDRASIRGVSGGVDADIYNGSLASLEAFAGVVTNHAPHGYLDSLSCSTATGWAQDTDVAASAIPVHLYFDGTPGQHGAALSTIARGHRSDLCHAIGSCNHGFSAGMPLSFRDNHTHTVRAYGINNKSGVNPELSHSPKRVSCAATLPAGVRRWILNPTSLHAWSFNTYWDMIRPSAAQTAAVPAGPNWPATLQCFHAIKDPAYYVVDGAFRRHIPNLAAAAAWRINLGHCATWTAAQASALKDGPPLRSRPVLAHEPDGHIDVIDTALPAVAATTTAAVDGSASVDDLPVADLPVDSVSDADPSFTEMAGATEDVIVEDDAPDFVTDLLGIVDGSTP